MKGKLVLAAMFALMLNACASLSPVEQAQYQALEKDLKATQLQEVEKKNAAAAGVLNVLPGFGNLYLGQPGLFVANLLTWPISPVWAVPQAAIDAGNVNKKHTIAYYNYGEGKETLKAELAKQESAPAAN